MEKNDGMVNKLPGFRAQVYRIFVAGPGDVSEEKKIIERAIAEWTSDNARDKKIVLLSAKWQDKTVPTHLTDPQDLINRHVLPDHDILIAVFKHRLGSKSPRNTENTIEEIDEFVNSNRPAALYFYEGPIENLDSLDFQQLAAIREFKTKYHTTVREGLIGSYKSLDDLEASVRRGLSRTLELYNLFPDSSDFGVTGLPNNPVSQEWYEKTDKALHNLDVKTAWSVVDHYFLYNPSEASLSAPTVVAYRNALRTFLSYCKGVNINPLKLTKHNAEIWVRSMQQNQSKPRTIGAKIAGVKRFYDAIRFANVFQADNPFLDVRAPAPKDDDLKAYTNSQVEAFLAIADEKQRAMVLLTADCGLKSHEIAKLRVQHVRLGSNKPHILIFNSQSKKMDEVLLSERAVAALRPLISQPRELVFWIDTETSRRHMRHLCEHTRTKYLGLKGLRNYCGFTVLDETGSLQEVSKRLRISDGQAVRFTRRP